MSIKLMTLVWDRFPASGSELLAMLALTDWCNDQGGSLHPSIAGLAKKIRVSESQARRVLHKLIDDGFISVVGNSSGGAPGTTRRYQINVEKLKSLIELCETGCMDVRGSTDATGGTDARYGSHGCAETGSADDTQTTSRTTKEPPISIPEWIDPQTFDDFVAMRKKIKKPMTDRAVTLLVGKLGKMRDAGHSVKDVLEQSIINCWQDVYEPKGQARNMRRQSPSAENFAGKDYGESRDL